MSSATGRLVSEKVTQLTDACASPSGEEFQPGRQMEALISSTLGPFRQRRRARRGEKAYPRPSPAPVSSAMIARSAQPRVQPTAAYRCWVAVSRRITLEPRLPVSPRSCFLPATTQLPHFTSSPSRFRNAASPASETSTHFGSGAALGTQLSFQFHHLYGRVLG